MLSPSPVRILLPAAQSLAEGAWLAVLYAALQAASGEVAHLGPIELGAVALGGMAWGRRRRWTSPVADAIGLPLLALVAGTFGWLLDPDVRVALVEGDPVGALSLHLPGWLAAAAFWRGEAHRVRDDDADTQDRLVRWAVPALAIPWLIGYASTGGQLEDDFTAAAFVGTIFFSGAAFSALGLARLEAMRMATGSDWRGNRSWPFMIVGMALALTAFAVPAAALLGIPERSLLATVVGPLQTLILLVVLLSAPIFILAAAIADLLAGLLPEDFRIDGLTLPSFTFSDTQPTSDLPLIILTVLVAAVFLFDFLALVALAWLGFRDRRRRADPTEAAFEERSIVVPDSSASGQTRAAAAPSRRFIPADDATGAYLAALAALAADGRWPRRQHETPAAHLVRTREEGLEGPSFGRLSAAYQLARYGPRPLGGREQKRAPGRLNALRGWLRRSQHS